MSIEREQVDDPLPLEELERLEDQAAEAIWLAPPPAQFRGWRPAYERDVLRLCREVRRLRRKVNRLVKERG